MTPNAAPDAVSRRALLAAVGAGAATVAGCVQSTDRLSDSSGDGSLSGTVAIAGSSTVFPLATQMKQLFQDDHPDVRISIQSTGSGGGFKNHFCPGRTDFNNASRPIKESEAQLCAEGDVEPVELKVATDALTVVVNNDADWVDCLTVDQLETIWSADAKPETWSDIDPDWPDEELSLFGPTEASGTYDYFIEAVLGEEGPGHRQDYQATEQDRTILNGVSNDEYAIGYMGFAYFSGNRESVKALGIDAGDGCVEPSLETAKGGEYTPLSRPLFTYPKQSALARPAVREFADFWIDNATDREIVAESVGYVPLGEAEQTEQLGILHAAIDDAMDAAREDE